MDDKIILSERDKHWIEALQDAAFEMNMDVDWETMRLVPIDRIWSNYEEGDCNVNFDMDLEEDNHEHHAASN